MVRRIVENHRLGGIQTVRCPQSHVCFSALFVPGGIQVLSDAQSSNSGSAAAGKKTFNTELAELGSDIFL